MKFAKELQRELVPEWQQAYLNYKDGKKRIKNVARAINRAKGKGSLTPNLARKSGDAPPHPTPSFVGKRKVSHRNEPSVGEDPATAAKDASKTAALTATRSHSTPGAGPSKPHALGLAATQDIPPPRAGGQGEGAEKQLLKNSAGNELQYGSFVATPPATAQADDALGRVSTYHQSFELPAPAMKVPSATEEHHRKPHLRNPFHRSHTMQFPLDGQESRGSAPGSYPSPKQDPSSRHARNVSRDEAEDPSTNTAAQQRMRRILSQSGNHGSLVRKKSYGSPNNLQQEAEELEDQFFNWLDEELSKVDNFYREKEAEAVKRLAALREQLHVMRNQRLHEIEGVRERRRTASYGHDESSGGNTTGDDGEPGNNKNKGSSWMNQGWLRPVKDRILDLSHPSPGPNSKALQKMPLTPRMKGAQDAARRDYTRRPVADDVPYRSAKHKLKLALQEFYRGLELLKSYALLNRTAFRKLNKKYDKAVNARPQYRYMHERVNQAYFVKSTALDTHVAAVEDLYARYFERGNHKIAAGKLRSLNRRPADESASAFRSGLLIGVGLVFAIQGCTYGAGLLFDSDPTVRQHTSYLMQIYGGYFLMLYLFVLFCLDCRLWTHNKINYQFIFEFDARSQLDWRQLFQFPAFFLLAFGVLIWANFTRMGAEEMYLYFPVILIGITVLILFFPAPVFYWRSRRWFLYSHWRLLLAGLYPVEFRDFFLGDIYCSLTYAMCNVELFFCLYHNRWDDPEQCNSSHSRLLGFFSTLPPIWRFLQCIRRYYDTRNAFPHLVNCGKYTMSIVAAMCLSLYRIDNTHTNLALFITFSSINAVYCSIWDIFMDFSLLQHGKKKNFLLRDIIGLKKRWPYYSAMIVDPILRFVWIFYAIFTHDAQHSTIVSFLVAFAEVSRRGMWTIFRVENEHCGNVAQYKASRDVPLPYKLEAEEQSSDPEDGLLGGDGARPRRRPQTSNEESEMFPAMAKVTSVSDAAASRSPAAAEEGRAGLTTADSGGGTIKRRLTRADTLVEALSRHMAEAHKQDFEKRRKPPISPPEDENDEDELYRNLQSAGAVVAGEDDDDDDESDDMEGGGAFSDDDPAVGSSQSNEDGAGKQKKP